MKIHIIARMATIMKESEADHVGQRGKHPLQNICEETVNTTKF